MRQSWTEIRSDLRKSAAVKVTPAAGEFWSDFRARARLRAQDRPETTTILSPWRRWTLASAGGLIAALLVLTGILMLRPRSSGEFSQMESLQIDAPHSAVLMMNDEDTQSTTVWILDLDADDAKGDSA